METTAQAGTYHITVEDGITITAACKTSRDIKRHKASKLSAASIRAVSLWPPPPLMLAGAVS